MKKMTNTIVIQGKLYDHDLQIKTTGATSKTPGVEFISGTVHIAVDDAMTNVIPIHFSYVVELTSKGTPNKTWTLLKSIVDGTTGSVIGSGVDKAELVQADSSLALNEWYDKDGKLVSVMRNEGGFLKKINEADFRKNRCEFVADMVVTNCARLEANEERGLPEKMKIRGAIFNFRGDVLPVEFSVFDETGISYFEGLGISSANPVFTTVKGSQISQTTVQRIEEPSAFGEPSVREVKRSYKDYVVSWARPEPMDWDTEETILASTLSEAMANREIYLASVKQRQDEYTAKKSAPTLATPAKGTYVF